MSDDEEAPLRCRNEDHAGCDGEACACLCHVERALDEALQPRPPVQRIHFDGPAELHTSRAAESVADRDRRWGRTDLHQGRGGRSI